MSSIGGINSSSLDITQLLKHLSNQQTNEDNTSVSGLKTLNGSSRPENRFADALKALGVSDDEVSSIQDDIKSAISDAMKNADSTTDVKSTIQSAVEQTLKDHGVGSRQAQDSTVVHGWSAAGRWNAADGWHAAGAGRYASGHEERAQ